MRKPSKKRVLVKKRGRTKAGRPHAIKRAPSAKERRREVSASSPVVSWNAPSPDDRVPSYYGEDRLMLMVRDPWWLFAYWEITPSKSEEAAHRMRQSGERDWRTVLRVYDITGGSIEKPSSYFDIELNFYADNWYIDVGLPDHAWIAELGLRGASGRFLAMVRSNGVRTPAFGISDVLDEEWLLPEDLYYRLIGLLGPGSQSGSMDVKRLLEKYLKQVVSSERLAPAPSLK